MAKKIENLSTSEIESYIQSSDIVLNKCNQILDFCKKISPDSEVDSEIKKVVTIRSEHHKLITKLQSELEKRMQNHFGLKYSGIHLKGIVEKLQEKFVLQESQKQDSADESKDNPKMKVLK